MKYNRFERARLIGARALQISMGAPSLLVEDSTGDPLSIAFAEFLLGSSPLNVQRIDDALD